MRAHNFSAGPAALPLPALEQARDELLDFQGTGMSIMEQSHRDAPYEAVHHEAQALLRELAGIPDSHAVLFLSGGASLQFAMVPMNLLGAGRSADYLMTGVWSEKAYAEAQTVGRARIAATTVQPDKRYTRIPRPDELQLDPDASYVHITSNNTIFGTQWTSFPDTGKAPLVADMSSDFLWRPVDVRRFGLIYAGAQKNLGPSGVLIAVIDRELAARGRTDIPRILRYDTHISADSLYNTPPTFGVYLVRNVLRWVKEQGGLTAMEVRNRKKAELLYGTLDAMRDFYTAPVERESRSAMNVVFRLPSEALDAAFVAEAKAHALVGLKGHRTTGGIRASLYNAVSVEDVQVLVGFMRDFARRHG
ncbi:MAG: 3-phosphoserine/phosphohydroxythreonine transaminase [Myxococcaceae bacterium]|nr:3-phosphoserine/phosphohydroxythreonine transaminase [Myxococcaceae bacterium]MCI0669664.1 3-phosphoserine/phosphohydroxythreonine transaminase [Myxococcaceae bacterium]